MLHGRRVSTGRSCTGDQRSHGRFRSAQHLPVLVIKESVRSRHAEDEPREAGESRRCRRLLDEETAEESSVYGKVR